MSTITFDQLTTSTAAQFGKRSLVKAFTKSDRAIEACSDENSSEGS